MQLRLLSLWFNQQILAFKNGGSITFILNGTFDSSTRGLFTNIAKVSIVTDANLTNNQANTTQDIIGSSVITYSLVIYNNGPTDSENTTVTDFFHPFFKSITGWTKSHANFSWVCTQNALFHLFSSFWNWIFSPSNQYDQRQFINFYSIWNVPFKCERNFYQHCRYHTTDPNTTNNKATTNQDINRSPSHKEYICWWIETNCWCHTRELFHCCF